jgi:Cu(I)/Ag(I) efflux system protein CusF
MLQRSAVFPTWLAALTLIIGSASFVLSSSDVRGEAMNMPGMKDTKGKAAKSATGTGTVAALNAANRKVTLDHAPMPEINWPAMKMEFPVAASVDLSKFKTGDKVRFSVTGSGSNYTVQSIAPSP